jgi:SAM-dependent methyltransferase
MRGIVRLIGQVIARAAANSAGWATSRPDLALVKLVEGEGEGAARGGPRRALDLGCGTGRNAIYLARHGWEVTGVELVGHLLDAARRNAATAGATVRWVKGDVTRLDELGIGGGYALLVDAGCYHAIPPGRRDAYAAGVTRVAAPGAVLLMVGFAGRRVPAAGVTVEELRRRFGAWGWELVDAGLIPAAEMRGYVEGAPLPVRAALGRGWVRAWRYRLHRRAGDGSRTSLPPTGTPGPIR